jgi:DNA modification methylase
VTIRVLTGHAPDVLSQMPAESVHLVVTSPPYLWLRSYGTEPQIWPNPDGTPLCVDGAHAWSPSVRWAQMGGVSEKQSTNRGNTGAGFLSRSGTCDRCGAWRGELGQEPTVERYIANLVSVFDAVRRVLRRDGLCWVNLAGSYFNNPGGQNGGVNNGLDYGAGRISQKTMKANRQAGRQDRIGAAGAGYWLKPLDFVDTPGLFAHAMQRAGWYWRADICLVKRAPLPESVSGWSWQRCRVRVAGQKVSPSGTYKGDAYQGSHHRAQGAVGYDPARGGTYFDSQAQWADCPGCSRCAPNDGLILRRGNGRPTRAWERFLVFAKAPGAYFDSEAVREPMAPASMQRISQDVAAQEGSWRANGGAKTNGAMKAVGDPSAGRNLRDWQFWPGSEMVRLRSDLTPEQRASVLRRIADADWLSSGSSDESSSEYPDAQ